MITKIVNSKEEFLIIPLIMSQSMVVEEDMEVILNNKTGTKYLFHPCPSNNKFYKKMYYNVKRMSDREFKFKTGGFFS